MLECFPKHLRMGTATIIKEDKETEVEGKLKKRVKIERVKRARDKEVTKA